LINELELEKTNLESNQCD